MRRRTQGWTAAALVLVLLGCGPERPPSPHDHAAHGHTPRAAAPAHGSAAASAHDDAPRRAAASAAEPGSVAWLVARAERGARVVVPPGVYREPTIVLDRPIELVGLPGAVLDGEGEREILVIAADSVTVRGFEFRDVGVSYIEDRAAVRADGARVCTIEDNRFDNAFFAIYLAGSSDCRIAGNVIRGRARSEASSGNAIHLWNSRRVRIVGNRIEGHRDGIYLEFVEDSEILENTSTGNLRYGLHFMFSDRCRYEGNVFRRNGAGVAVMYTRHVEMTGNRFEDNQGSASFGLLLKDISDSRVERNVFRSNTVGLYAEGSNRTVVEGNDFVANGWAVRILANSLDNEFRRNNFTGNTFDVATNSRTSYSTFEHNHWDAYRGYDLDRDGTGDVPHYPVRLFSLLVERNEPALALLRSPFVSLLDAAERVLPVLTPEALVDRAPAMRAFAREETS
jgi:nitrous oxidase accessory protein